MKYADHECSDPHWQAVLAMVGKPFDRLTTAGQIAVIDAISRRRALHDHETDMLCELIELQQRRAQGWHAKQRRVAAV